MSVLGGCCLMLFSIPFLGGKLVKSICDDAHLEQVNSKVIEINKRTNPELEKEYWEALHKEEEEERLWGIIKQGAKNCSGIYSEIDFDSNVFSWEDDIEDESLYDDPSYIPYHFDYEDARLEAIIMLMAVEGYYTQRWAKAKGWFYQSDHVKRNKRRW